jgi:hypothetical protein
VSTAVRKLLNLGYIEHTHDDRALVARVYYDRAPLVEHPNADEQLARLAPLIDGAFVNGGRGWCLDVVNKTRRAWRLIIVAPAGDVLDEVIPPGGSLTMKAADMAARGFRNRGDASDLRLV